MGLTPSRLADEVADKKGFDVNGPPMGGPMGNGPLGRGLLPMPGNSLPPPSEGLPFDYDDDEIDDAQRLQQLEARRAEDEKRAREEVHQPIVRYATWCLCI